MAKVQQADILALGDKKRKDKEEYDISSLAGLIKSKFIGSNCNKLL